MNTCESRRHYLKFYEMYILHQHTTFKCQFTISNGLNVNEDFIIVLTSKLITFFIDGFTSGMKS